MLLPLPLIQLETSKGSLDLVLFEDELPNTTACFLSLVEQGFFNGTKLVSRLLLDPGRKRLGPHL